MADDDAEFDDFDDLGIDEIEKLFSPEAALERRRIAREAVQVSVYWQWKPPVQQFCTMNGGQHGWYLNDAELFTQKKAESCEASLLYIYAALDPSALLFTGSEACLHMRIALEKAYKVKKPHLTIDELWTILRIVEQTDDEFQERFKSIDHVKAKTPHLWKRKVHEKMNSVLGLLTECFHFGELEEEPAAKLIVHLLECAADPWVDASLNYSIVVFINKIFKDQKEKQWSLCRAVYEKMRSPEHDSTYIHSILRNAVLVWPMQAYSAVFVNALLAEQAQTLEVRRAREERKEGGSVDGVSAPAALSETVKTEEMCKINDLPPIASSVEMEKEINVAVRHISAKLPRVLKQWLKVCKSEETYMWLDTVSMAFSLYTVSACTDLVSEELENAYDGIMRRLKRHKTNSDHIVMKTIATLRQIHLSRWNYDSRHLNMSSEAVVELAQDSGSHNYL